MAARGANGDVQTNDTRIVDPEQHVHMNPEGRACFVCDHRIGAEGLALLHKGRHVYLCSGACRGAWESNKDALFARIQARGALFDEESIVENQKPMRVGWLVFGVYILIGVCCGAASSYIAVSKGHGALAWFFLGLLFNIPALAVVATKSAADLSALPAGVPSGLAKVPTTRNPAVCTSCGASNHPSAASCSACSAALEPTVPAETQRV